MGNLDVNMGLCNESESRNECDKPTVAVCSICQKGFKSVWGYKCHVRIHAISVGKVDNSFKCLVCGNFYPTKARLRQHMRCHSNERPFSCNKCGRAYKHNCGLKTHMCTGEGIQWFVKSRSGYSWKVGMSNGTACVRIVIAWLVSKIELCYTNPSYFICRRKSSSLHCQDWMAWDSEMFWEFTQRFFGNMLSKQCS